MELNELRFKTAEKNLEEIFFQVELGNVLVENMLKGFIKANNFKAIYSPVSSYIFSIVTNKYKLIRNEEAYILGKKVFNQLFPSINIAEIRPFNVIFPSTRSHCHIQLIHEQVNFTVWEQDTWLPFIQVSNSYNRTQALTFEFGFVRKLCSNGLILRKNTVKFKYPHNKSLESLEIKIYIASKELKQMEMEFIQNMNNLKRFYISPNYIIPLTCKILNLKYYLNNEDKLLKKREYKKFYNFQVTIQPLIEDYFKTIGHNAYAALNVVTDLLSNHYHCLASSNFHIATTDFFYKPAVWINDFIVEIENKDFDIKKYLTKEVEMLEWNAD